MSGRGDNNKHGSSGRGASNQSNQPFVINGENQPRSNHNKGARGGESKTYNLLVDDVPYVVVAEPFSFNGEKRFYIKINEGDDHVFTWDSELGRLRAIDDESGTMPEALEQAISARIQQRII